MNNIAGSVPATLTTVQHAAAMGLADTLRQLPVTRDQANEVLSDGRTSLHLAAHQGHAEVLELLIAAGGNVDARAGGTKRTPVHVAAMAGHPDAVSVLIGAGCEVNAEDYLKRTPASWASDYANAGIVGGHAEALRLLYAADRERREP